MIELFQRGIRYVSTWRWLMSVTLAAAPVMWCTAVASGFASRLGSLAGFVAAIRCAAWILSPESLPPFILALQIDPDTMLWILVFLPGLIFLATAVFSLIHNWSATRLEVKLASSMSAQHAHLKLQQSAIDGLLDAPVLKLVASELKREHARLFAVHLLAMNFVVLCCVLSYSYFPAVDKLQHHWQSHNSECWS